MGLRKVPTNSPDCGGPSMEGHDGHDALLEIEESLAVLRGLGVLVSVLDKTEVAQIWGAPLFALGTAIQHYTAAGERALETAMGCRGESAGLES